MSFLIFILAVLGLTGILVDSVLFKNVRDKINSLNIELLNELISCHVCMSTWVGMVLGPIILGNPWHFLIYGFVANGLTYTYHQVFNLIENYVLSQVEINVDDEQ